MVKDFEKIIVGKLVIKEYLFLLLLFLLASFLRISYAFYLKGDVPVSDAAGFELLGISILKYGAGCLLMVKLNVERSIYKSSN